VRGEEPRNMALFVFRRNTTR